MASTAINHAPHAGQFEFDVAFSFAEEDRRFVHRVAERLKRSHIKIFYDKDALIDTWGKNMYTHLDNIYRNKARFCVMFISEHYKKKRWTQHEKDSAQARAFFMENKEYILPFRFDDAEIEGIKDTIGYLSINGFDEKKLADAIITKISNTDHRAVPHTFHTGKNIGLSAAAKAGRLLRLRMKAILLFAVTAVALTFFFNYYNHKEDTPAQQLFSSNPGIVRGSRCKDGTFSPSRGSGTCSHHDGVNYLDSMPYDQYLKETKQRK